MEAALRSKGRDITALGIPPGKRVGELLAAAPMVGRGDFTADRALSEIG
jgi:hypothetical protein